jgi:predicted nucleotidyltransferase
MLSRPLNPMPSTASVVQLLRRLRIVQEVAPVTTLAFPLPTDAIRQFCRRWKIRELALFGSVLRTDFRPDSDVDVLVTFHDDADWGLLAHIQMQQELATLLHRPIDLISKRALERSPNWLRRETILNTAQVIVSTDEAGDGPR